MSPEKHILLVEDHDDLLELWAEWIKMEGFSVTKANNGEEGFKLAEQKHPDLIISDYMMPRCSGLELLEKLKTSRYLNDIPVVILTAISEINIRISALKLGAERFLIKPLDRKTFIQEIKNVLQLNSFKKKLVDLILKKINKELHITNPLKTESEIINTGEKVRPLIENALNYYGLIYQNELNSIDSLFVGEELLDLKNFSDNIIDKLQKT